MYTLANSPFLVSSNFSSRILSFRCSQSKVFKQYYKMPMPRKLHWRAPPPSPLSREIYVNSKKELALKSAKKGEESVVFVGGIRTEKMDQDDIPEIDETTEERKQGPRGKGSYEFWDGERNVSFVLFQTGRP